MRRSVTMLAVVALAATAFGQVGFECAPLGPLPGDPSANCEGVASDNQVAATGVVSAPSCGFPASGTQYLLIAGDTGLAPPPPLGGPVPRPIAAAPSEIRIPIPAGATTVSFNWEFFTGEAVSAITYNDGISIDVVNPAGALVGNLVYADTSAGYGTCLSILTGAAYHEVLPAGSQTFTGPLPAYGPCDYISIAVWNGTDTAFDPSAYVDNFVFDTAVPGCQVPCLGIVPVLGFSSPSGSGCILINLSGLPSGGTYFLAATLNPPPGWLYGVNIGIPELVNEINTGYPFWGPLGAGGCSGTASIGQFCGLPSGLTIYAVGLGLPGVGLNGPISSHTPAGSYTIP
jgi:hypothetical protein